MQKTEALELLGGTVRKASQLTGLSPQTLYSWPDTLTDLMVDRVHAALWRKQEREKREARLAQLEAAQHAPGAAP